VGLSVDYNPPPTLDAFLCSNAFVRCCVGPVGSGKSSACVVEILRRAMEQTPGPDKIRRSRFVVIRNTYGQLRDTTRKTFEQWIPERLGKWHEQEFLFEMRFRDVHCEVLFRALDRPEDIRKLLSLELTGAYINEAREIPKHVFDVLQTRIGRYPSKNQGGPKWFGIWLDTNPWHTGHWGYKTFTVQKPAGYEIFEQPDGLTSEAENKENLPPGYYERLRAGKDQEWIDCYVRGKYPSSQVGSIYGALLGELGKRGGILDFDFPLDGVFTNWDLGLSDSTAIWFWRINKHLMPDVIDFYEAHGEKLSHFFDVIDRRGYSYSKHWLPHDARARTLQTGVSVQEQFAQRYGQSAIAIGPELSLLDGIAAARWLLEQKIRFHKTNCAQGLEALKSYRYEWDEDSQVFSRRPVHDWASHTADAFRYMACVVKATELLSRKESEPKEKGIRRLHYDFTLDELWEAHEAEAARKRI